MATISNEIKNKIGESIKKFRLMKNYSARELSASVGIAPSNLSAIESGERTPKLDMCRKIASVLEVDPVELCGIELSETDEKRLLMKLLAKYADNIEINSYKNESGKKEYDPSGKSTVTLPVDFADFAIRYEEHKSAVAFALEGVDETDPRYELIKGNAEDEFNWWMDVYPDYDAVILARLKAKEGVFPSTDKEKSISWYQENGDVDFASVDIWSSLLQEEMNPDFWSFQSEYIIPGRNEAWRAKYIKKDD